MLLTLQNVVTSTVNSPKCVFIGYAEDHSHDTFRFYNPEIDKIFLSRDVTKWLEWHGRIAGVENMELFEHLERPEKFSIIPETNATDQPPDDDDDPPFLPEGINAEAPNISIPLSLPQTELSQTSSHEAVNIDPPAEIPEKIPPPRHKLLREIKGLQTSYNPISLEDILHIFNVNDKSYPV